MTVDESSDDSIANVETAPEVRPVGWQEADEDPTASATDAERSGQPETAPAQPPLEGVEPLPIVPAVEEGQDLRGEAPRVIEPVPAEGILDLPEVLQSVAECYPLIDVAFAEIEAAEGKVISSWGEFDSTFEAFSISQPLGFYQNYRNGLAVSRPLFGGGEVIGGYRIGDGDFEPWYGERETDEGGEFKAGFSLPLLKDRNIDARRAGLFSAEQQRDQVAANVNARLLQFQRFSAQAYWDWVAAGRAVQVQEQLLDLAEVRVAQIQARINEEDLPRIAAIDNDRFIAKRKNDLAKARREFEKAAIKLSLFLRDAQCRPVIAGPAQLPPEFPEGEPLTPESVASAIQQAISVRPELAELEAARQETTVQLRYAENLTLPKVDVKGYAAKDVGGLASSSGNKEPFQLEIGVLAEVPIQRREGLGKIRTAEAKLAQLESKIRFVREKVTAEVQDAASALNAAVDQIVQSKENVRLAKRSLEIGEELFDNGDIDLIELNIRESAAADAEFDLISANVKYFFALAAFETAIRATGF